MKGMHSRNAEAGLAEFRARSEAMLQDPATSEQEKCSLRFSLLVMPVLHFFIADERDAGRNPEDILAAISNGATSISASAIGSICGDKGTTHAWVLAYMKAYATGMGNFVANEPPEGGFSIRHEFGEVGHA